MEIWRFRCVFVCTHILFFFSIIIIIVVSLISFTCQRLYTCKSVVFYHFDWMVMVLTLILWRDLCIYAYEKMSPRYLRCVHTYTLQFDVIVRVIVMNNVCIYYTSSLDAVPPSANVTQNNKRNEISYSWKDRTNQVTD